MAANYRLKINAQWTQPLDAELIKLMNEHFDGSVSWVASSIIGAGENKIARLKTAFGYPQLAKFYRFLQGLVNGGFNFKGLMELYTLCREAMEEFKKEEDSKKLTVEDILKTPMHPDVQKIKADFRSRILKKAQWGFEGKLDSVNDAIEYPVHEEQEKHITGAKILIAGKLYTLGHKLHDDSDEEVYESWWSSPDLSPGFMLHYTQVYNSPDTSGWEVEKDATAKTNFRKKIIAQMEVQYKDPLEKARRAIMREDPICFDVAAEHGQMFGNVKHMKWFVEAVAEEMA